MTRHTVLLPSGTAKEISGVPTAGSGAPGAPTNLVLTPAVGALLATWDAPTVRNGSPLFRYRVVVTGGPGGGTYFTARTERQLLISGLTDYVTYTVSVTAANGVGTSTAVEGTEQPVSPAPFDPRTFPYAEVCGPREAPLTTIDATSRVQPTTDLSRVLIESSNDLGFMVPSGLHTNLALTDCELRVPYASAGDQNEEVHATNCRFAPTVAAQTSRGAATGALSGFIGSTDYCEIIPASDSIQGSTRHTRPAKGMTEHRYAWLHSRGYKYWGGKVPLIGGLPGETIGRYMNDEEAESMLDLAATSFAAGKTVETGDIIQAFTGGDQRAYLVMEGGTLGPSVAGWPSQLWDRLAPTDTTQPFTSGTASLAVIGPHAHSDGVQTVNSGHIRLWRCRIEGHANAAALIQCATAPRDGANVPVQRIRFEECYLKAGPPGGYFWLYIAGHGYGTALQRTSGVWGTHAFAFRSRPWGSLVKDCWFGSSPGGAVPSITSSINNAEPFGQSALFVNSIDQWKAGVAAQFDLDVVDDAATLTQMWDGMFDWTNDTPPLNQAVLNTRLTNGLTERICDARGWIVWANNRREADGAQMHPTYWQNRPGTTGFDASGYYQGG